MRQNCSIANDYQQSGKSTTLNQEQHAFYDRQTYESHTSPSRYRLGPSDRMTSLELYVDALCSASLYLPVIVAAWTALVVPGFVSCISKEYLSPPKAT